jgi:hypothetical protein
MPRRAVHRGSARGAVCNTSVSPDTISSALPRSFSKKAQISCAHLRWRRPGPIRKWRAEMKALRLALACFVFAALFAAAGTAQAAPVNFTLVRTSPLYNEDPPGAPLPLGRIQRDAGNVLFNNQKIGEYLWIKDVHDGTLNTAAVTLTLFLPSAGGGAPTPITLMGSHDFSSGNGKGSIAASSIAALVGVTFTYSTVTDILTLNLP